MYFLVIIVGLLDSLNCIDIQEKGEGVRVLYLKSKDGYNELKAVGTFADIKAGEKVWVHFPIEELRVYDKKSEQIVA